MDRQRRKFQLACRSLNAWTKTSTLWILTMGFGWIPQGKRPVSSFLACLLTCYSSTDESHELTACWGCNCCKQEEWWVRVGVRVKGITKKPCDYIKASPDPEHRIHFDQWHGQNFTFDLHGERKVPPVSEMVQKSIHSAPAFFDEVFLKGTFMQFGSIN